MLLPGNPKSAKVLAALILVWPAAAFAHSAPGMVYGFLSGIEHPPSGLDHVLAMVAVGMWSAQLGGSALWLLPLAFPLVMAVGGLLGFLGLPLAGVEVGIAASALVLGAMVLGEARPCLLLAAVAVGVFALFHGHAHGTELPAGASGLAYSLGFILATVCLHGTGILLGLIVHRWSAGRLALRAGGAAVSAGGLFFLWHAVA